MNTSDYTCEGAGDLVTKIPIRRKTYSIGIGITLAFATLLLVAFFGTPPQPNKWAFFLCAGVLCLGGLCVFIAYPIFNDKYALRIDGCGIHERFFTGPRSILWNKIESIGICRTAQGNAIALQYKSGSFGRIFTFGQYDAWLCNLYSINNDQLLVILRDWKQKWPETKSQNAG